jgi:NitT/TauT family transport system substrate-binding protein
VRKQWVFGASLLGLAALIIGAWYVNTNGEGPNVRPMIEKVTINEAVRTLLYIPLYHAQERGYFKEEGLDVEIVTGGTATVSFAAMLSGEAHFSQADPMYVPISREKGGRTKVVAQVVARIAVWAVARDPEITALTAENLRGKTISTHPAPMTAYTYTIQLLEQFGLDPNKDVTIINSKPGTELAPLFANQADIAMTLEPGASQAIAEGAHIVHSFPEALGDQVFTALMTTEDYIESNRTVVEKLVRCYQKSLDDLRRNPEGAVDTAKAYFPEVQDAVLIAAISRMVKEQVIPETVDISDASWKQAIEVRIRAGDLSTPVSKNDAADIPRVSLKRGRE